MVKPLVILLGPTAVGKTDSSIELAKKLNGEIISADSMQIYKYMNVGTAKPTLEEMGDVKHHLVDIIFPDEEFSVAVFRNMAEECIDDILSRNKLPIVAGGTGLYINSLTHNLDFTETISDSKYRESMQKLAQEYGNSYIHNILKAVDPESFERLHENDTRRIIRALEVYKYTGKTISQFQKESKNKAIDFDLCVVGLTMDRQKLYERINMRVDNMINEGLVDEVLSLLRKGYSKNLTSMQGLGYKEIIAYIEGECSLEGAVEKLKQNTRHFAKRQLTWFRREQGIHWINVDNFEYKGDIVKNIAYLVAGKFNLV